METKAHVTIVIKKYESVPLHLRQNTWLWIPRDMAPRDLFTITKNDHMILSHMQCQYDNVCEIAGIRCLVITAGVDSVKPKLMKRRTSGTGFRERKWFEAYVQVGHVDDWRNFTTWSSVGLFWDNLTQ